MQDDVEASVVVNRTTIKSLASRSHDHGITLVAPLWHEQDMIKYSIQFAMEGQGTFLFGGQVSNIIGPPASIALGTFLPPTATRFFGVFGGVLCMYSRPILALFTYMDMVTIK